jgi:hypothetical protein
MFRHMEQSAPPRVMRGRVKASKGLPMFTDQNTSPAVATSPAPSTREEIAEYLREAGVRCTPYALGVAEGWQSLSGADLKGKASRYGASYHRTRLAVVAALEAKGWAVVRLPLGKLELRE